jgi:SAM-dependent methyltransferase
MTSGALTAYCQPEANSTCIRIYRIMADERTSDYYQYYVSDLFNRYDVVASPLQDCFAMAFMPGSRVMDVGCGTGRDLRTLLQAGYEAVGVEPSAALRTECLHRYPQLEAHLQAGALPDITVEQPFDGVLCSAVLMHLPASQHLEAFVNLRNLLRVGGRLLLSIPARRDDLDAQHRDPYGRLFVPLQVERLKLLAAQLGMNFLNQFESDDALGRQGVGWHVLLFERGHAGNRPLDRIESVLKHDLKAATYKLALLRAFCDIAERDAAAVQWYSEGFIGMPIRALAECWMRYYWPLIAAPVRIPQSRTDQGGARPIAFRAELHELIRLCCHTYDPNPDIAFSLLMAGWKKNNLPGNIQRQKETCLGKITSTMIEGPIAHAAKGDMFSFNSSARQVMLDVELWREFCLSGYWIRDALILRWAKLCEDFARKHNPQLHLGLVLPYLLLDENIQREQNIARQLYLDHRLPDSLRCVWSDRQLNSCNMDIDHVLPFSLWHNNDLWNLLPAEKNVNNAKKAKIPTPAFLRQRRDTIIDNWQFAHRIEQSMFEFEVQRTLGDFNRQCWENDLFQHLSERAAQAIYQRGEEAWMLAD